MSVCVCWNDLFVREVSTGYTVRHSRCILTTDANFVHRCFPDAPNRATLSCLSRVAVHFEVHLKLFSTCSTCQRGNGAKYQFQTAVFRGVCCAKQIVQGVKAQQAAGDAFTFGIDFRINNDTSSPSSD